MKITIGANIKRLRQKKGITQEDLACAMNVSCTAVSKWERGETYPDITLLTPLAYYFGITLDELMEYDENIIKARIDEIIREYSYCRDWEKAHEIIENGYREFPNDYAIMFHYMYEIAGGSADNDPEILMKNRNELLNISDKLLAGCTDIDYRLGAWDIRAKLLRAEGKTEEAVRIYREYFPNWYCSGEQKEEQLFSKDTDEFYYCVRKNLFELSGFAADKLGKKLFFDKSLSLDEKAEMALNYANGLDALYDSTKEEFFLVEAESFMGRMANDLCFRGGTVAQIVRVTDRRLSLTKKLSEIMKPHTPLYDAVFENIPEEGETYFEWTVNVILNYKYGRKAELLENEEYLAVLKKYL